MARCPFAVWKGPVPNRVAGGMQHPVRGAILHVIVGTLASADSVFHRSSYQASAHFGVGKGGECWQWVDTDDRAWAEGAGNPYWYSIETEGQPTEALTAAQLERVAQLLAWLSKLDGFPLQVTDATDGHGLGTHQMGGAAWGGHACPGTIRAGQRQAIVDQAKRITQQEGPLMALTDDEQRDLLANVNAIKEAVITDASKSWLAKWWDADIGAIKRKLGIQ